MANDLLNMIRDGKSLFKSVGNIPDALSKGHIERAGHLFNKSVGSVGRMTERADRMNEQASTYHTGGYGNDLPIAQGAPDSYEERFGHARNDSFDRSSSQNAYREHRVSPHHALHEDGSRRVLTREERIERQLEKDYNGYDRTQLEITRALQKGDYREVENLTRRLGVYEDRIERNREKLGLNDPKQPEPPLAENRAWQNPDLVEQEPLKFIKAGDRVKKIVTPQTQKAEQVVQTETSPKAAPPESSGIEVVADQTLKIQEPSAPEVEIEPEHTAPKTFGRRLSEDEFGDMDLKDSVPEQPRTLVQAAAEEKFRQGNYTHNDINAACNPVDIAIMQRKWSMDETGIADSEFANNAQNFISNLLERGMELIGQSLASLGEVFNQFGGLKGEFNMNVNPTETMLAKHDATLSNESTMGVTRAASQVVQNDFTALG